MARFGIDIWMTTTAIADGFKVCQAFLGAKLHNAKDPGSDLADMLVQVASSVFDLMETRIASGGPKCGGAEPVPLFGFPHGVGLEPVNVNVERMLGIFRGGARDLLEIWEKALAPETLTTVLEVAHSSREPFLFPEPLWVRVVYDFAVAYHRRVMPGSSCSAPWFRSTWAAPRRSCWAPRAAAPTR